MKKVFIVAGMFVGFALLAAVMLSVWKFATITDPYCVEPISVSVASGGAKVGYSVKLETRPLSVSSSNEVVVVADPGTSFRYEVLWLVERRRSDGTHGLMAYTYKLPRFAAVNHINAPTTEPPPEIRKAAGSAVERIERSLSGQWALKVSNAPGR